MQLCMFILSVIMYVKQWSMLFVTSATQLICHPTVCQMYWDVILLGVLWCDPPSPKCTEVWLTGLPGVLWCDPLVCWVYWGVILLGVLWCDSLVCQMYWGVTHRSARFAEVWSTNLLGVLRCDQPVCRVFWGVIYQSVGCTWWTYKPQLYPNVLMVVNKTVNSKLVWSWKQQQE